MQSSYPHCIKQDSYCFLRERSSTHKIHLVGGSWDSHFWLNTQALLYPLKGLPIITNLEVLCANRWLKRTRYEFALLLSGHILDEVSCHQWWYETSSSIVHKLWSVANHNHNLSIHIWICSFRFLPSNLQKLTGSMITSFLQQLNFEFEWNVVSKGLTDKRSYNKLFHYLAYLSRFLGPEHQLGARSRIQILGISLIIHSTPSM